MGVGLFRHRVQFQERLQAIDEFGQPSDEFTTVFTSGARTTQLSGNERERFSQGVATEEDFVSIEVRYSPTLDALPSDSRVIFRGDAFDVISKNDINFRGQYIRFVLRGVR